jgi:hypothetical protein
MDDQSPSTAQKNWVGLAEQMRAKLAAKVEEINAETKVEDVEKVMAMLRSAFWMHVEASLFDKKVELGLNKFSDD